MSGYFSVNLTPIITILNHNMSKYFQGLVFIILLIAVKPSFCQSDTAALKNDSTIIAADSNLVYYFAGTLENFKEQRFTEPDTLLTYFHQYDPARHHNRMYATLDNIGLAGYNRVFTLDKRRDFIWMPDNFKYYLFHNNNVEYPIQQNPFTELFYVMGPQKEQNLQVKFSRKISQRLTVGMKLRLIHSPGAYSRSFADNRNFYGTAQYYTANYRYGIIANYLFNNNRMQENGGLLYDSIFEQHLEVDPKVIPMRLKEAENKLRTSSFYVEQYFNLLKPDSKKKITRKLDAGSIIYALQYEKNYQIYSDKPVDSLFYKAFPVIFDTLSTYDSIYTLRIKNRIQWSNLGYNEDELSKHFRLHFGIKYNYIKQQYPYDSVARTFYETSPFGGLAINVFNASKLKVNGQFTVGGYNNGDFEIHGTLSQYIGSEKKNFGELVLRMDLLNKMPDYYFSYFRSNRFNWQLSLKKERTLILGGEYHYKDIKIGAKLQTLNNYTYLNTLVHPEQHLTTGSIFQFYTNGTIMYKKVGINFRLVYQKTSMPKIIRLPEFSGMADLFFRGWVFKHAGRLQSGLQFYYFTSYYANAYMPELRSFYLQDKQKIGNYLFADVYASLKVKTFRIFFKYTNLLTFLHQYRYYSTPSYPAGFPGFYMGVCWRFHN